MGPVSCPAENTLLGYVAGTLDEGASVEVEQHLDGCSTCRFLFADLARGDEASDGPASRTPGVDRTGSGPEAGASKGRLSPSSLDIADPLELPTGTVVGRYVILGLLGRGGMGVVYKAFDPELDRPIALKLVGLAGLGRGADEARQRLTREARTLARLSHANVVAVHDVGTFEGDVFLAMEFVPGRTLRAWLREREPGPREVLAVYREAGAGLAAAHRVGIVHRDFKPDNVMVGDDGRVRVLDFGLARSAIERGAGSAAEVATEEGEPEPVAAADLEPLTRAGALVGTPGYMAPEQDRGAEVDARSDQFSFCAALFEGLYGRLPFEGTSYRELAEHRLAGDIVSPPTLRGVGPRVRRAILHGLRRDPAARHRDMDALLVDLARRPWATRARIGALLLVLAAAASGAWALWIRTSDAPSIAETCAAAGADVERIWNPARREAMVRGLAGTGHPDGPAIAAQAAAALDRWAAEWTAKRVELCEMPMRRVPVTDRFVAHRLQCLERRIGVIDAFVTAYIEATSPRLTAGVLDSISKLESPASCDELVVGNPTDEEKERWKPAMNLLVQAWLDLAEGRPEEAIRAATEVETSARAGRDLEPLCAALDTIGKGRAMLGEVDAARQTLREAIRVCTEVKEEGLAADAWSELVGLAMRTTRFDAELDLTIFSAELAALRLPPEDLRSAEMAYRIGTVRFMRGDSDEAVRQLRRADELWRKAGAEKHKVELAGLANSLALMEVSRGQWDEAMTAFQSALAAWKAAGPPGALNHATTTGNLGLMRMLQRRYAEAEPLLREQLAAIEAMVGTLGAAGPVTLADAKIDLALLYVMTSRCAEAGPLLASGVAVGVTARSDAPLVEMMGRLGQGLCQLERGQVRAAVVELERAHEVAQREAIAVFQRPRVGFALARALWASGRHRPRAVSLAREALTGYARILGASAEKAEVEAWLADRAPR
jgi:tetratricopeptide (TPR) repeat protein/predicted Ser/Thr protein kinase